MDAKLRTGLLYQANKNSIKIVCNVFQGKNCNLFEVKFKKLNIEVLPGTHSQHYFCELKVRSCARHVSILNFHSTIIA